MKKLFTLLMCGLLLLSCSKDVESDESQVQFERPKFIVAPITFNFGRQGGTALFSCQCTSGKFERCYFVEYLTLDGFKFSPNEWTGRNQDLMIRCPPLDSRIISLSGSCGAIYVDYKVPDGRIVTEHVCYIKVHQE